VRSPAAHILRRIFSMRFFLNAQIKSEILALTPDNALIIFSSRDLATLCLPNTIIHHDSVFKLMIEYGFTQLEVEALLLTHFCSVTGLH